MNILIWCMRNENGEIQNMAQKKKYLIEECCFICDWCGFQMTPKYLKVGFKIICINPARDNTDIPEEKWCDKFKPNDVCEEVENEK